jgi:hypothetical protein
MAKSNWTEEDLKSYYNRLKGGDARTDLTRAKMAPASSAEAGAIKKSRMNKWEAEYAIMLEALRMAGEIEWWGFESLKFRLADSTWYTPDFIVCYDRGCDCGAYDMEAHEVKGFWRDDALVKFKVTAELFPWLTFKAFRKRRAKDGGGWEQIR